MTKIILIRHGETDYNLNRKYCGFSDPPLNDTGVLQAEKLAKKIRHLKIDKIYSSDLKRAHQTAGIIFPDKNVELTDNFREMNFGIFEGLNYKEITAKTPNLYQDWINDPIKTTIPEGENLISMNTRVKEKLNGIIANNDKKTIVIITHAGPLRVILCEALNKNLSMFWQIDQDNAAVNIIDYASNASVKVISMNEISHLKEQE